MSRAFLGAALAASLIALPFGAGAQSKMVIKASDVHPPGYPNIVAMENMGKKLEKETNGRLTMQMYHSMQLGGEKEMIEQAQVGALQIARVSVGTLGPVIDDPIGEELLAKVTASPARLVALGWMDAGTRNVYTSKPITKPADLKGLKMRTMGNPL